MFKTSVAFVVSSFIGLQSSCALKILPIADQQTSQIEIAKKEFTRISIKDDRIKQIFGGTQDLTIEVDEEGGQIFIKPLESHTRSIRMTLITETGLTHDLKIIPRLKDAESILFMAGQVPACPEPISHPPTNRNEEILQMIKKVTNTNLPQSSAPLIPEDREYEGLSLKLHKQYREGHYIIRYYHLTNCSDVPVFLYEKDLEQPGDLTMILAEHYLEPGETTLFYVVTEKDDENPNPLR